MFGSKTSIGVNASVRNFAGGVQWDSAELNDAVILVEIRETAEKGIKRSKEKERKKKVGRERKKKLRGEEERIEKKN